MNFTIIEIRAAIDVAKYHARDPKITRDRCDEAVKEMNGHPMSLILATELERQLFRNRIPDNERPQDPELDGNGWEFTTMEHGGRLPDAMPQVIKGTDPSGRFAFYSAISD